MYMIIDLESLYIVELISIISDNIQYVHYKTALQYVVRKEFLGLFKNQYFDALYVSRSKNRI
jgi:hypothetical protein